MITRHCKCGCGGELTVWKNGYSSDFLRGHHMRKQKEKPCSQLCACGCGNLTKISKNGKVSKFLLGHHKRKPFDTIVSHSCACGCGKSTNRGKKFVLGHHMILRSKEKPLLPSKLCKCGCGKYTNTPANGVPRDYCQGHHTKGKRLSIEKRINRNEKYQNTESPYVPGMFISFNTRTKRWGGVTVKNGKWGHILHARAVYEHTFGAVPEGCHVHHKNGKHESIDDDRPENLMALPEYWNLKVFPVLAKGFGVSQSVITEAYLEEVVRVQDSELFQAVCRNVIETKLGK
jgi:hypothetical protein